MVFAVQFDKPGSAPVLVEGDTAELAGSWLWELICEFDCYADYVWNELNLRGHKIDSIAELPENDDRLHNGTHVFYKNHCGDEYAKMFASANYPKRNPYDGNR